MGQYFTVPVEASLQDFEDDEIIQYLEESGYTVSYKNQYLEKAAWYVSRGDLKSAVLEIERSIPELKGLADLVKKNTT